MGVAGRRLPFMALAGLSLLTALWAGLLRLGWPLPLLASTLPPNHGPLLLIGFLGTIIGLERAVALKRRWPYGAPLLAGMAGLGLLVGVPPHAAHALAAGSGAFLIAIFVVLFRQDPTLHLATMGTGVVLWLAGTLLWHGGSPLYRVAPWWVGFLVLTIAGERLELSRLLRLSAWARAGFVAAIGVVVLGVVAGLFAHEAGVRLGGFGLVALAAWLLRYDLAWRALGQPALPRFMAVNLLSGYAWLGLGGLLWLGFADRFTAGPYYDAMLHAVFLGFVFSMIFGHAPIMFPAVMGVALPFQPAFYAHFVLLHLSLLARVGGVLAAWPPAQRWGGLVNALAVLLFLANNIRAVRRGHQEGGMAPTKEEILEALKGVYDPEIPVDIVNLGLVYEVAIDGARVRLRMTTTARGCPVGEFIAAEAERAVRKLPGVEAAQAELVWDPPWTPERMSPEAKRKLGWR